MGQEEENGNRAAGMGFLRAVEGCITEYRIRIGSVRDDLYIYCTEDKLHVTGMQKTSCKDRLPKAVISYESRGRRLLGRPRKNCFPYKPEQAAA
jgi:hypothetical protein